MGGGRRRPAAGSEARPAQGRRGRKFVSGSRFLPAAPRRFVFERREVPQRRRGNPGACLAVTSLDFGATPIMGKPFPQPPPH